MGSKKKGKADEGPTRAIYQSAEPQLLHLGRTHYPWLLDRCLEIARESGRNPVHVVWALAQLSPMCTVTENIKMTEMMCRSPHYRNPGTTHTFAHKAWKALHGNTHEVTGLKVRAFTAAILGDTQSVTLDRWMLRLLGHDADSISSVSGYDRYAGVIKRVARKVGETPRDLQAIVWLAVREETRILL